MAARIEVYPKVIDSRAGVRKRQFEQVGIKGKVSEVKLADSYTIDARLTPRQLQLAGEVLINPLIEKIHAKPPFKFNYAIEIGYLPGVTDNVATTAKEAIEDRLGIKLEDSRRSNKNTKGSRDPDSTSGVYTSRVFFVSGSVTEADVKKIADSLHNPLIERASIYTYAQFTESRKAKPTLPKVALTPGATNEVNLWVSDEELLDLSKKSTWALDLDSLKAIRTHFQGLGRNPNDIEMESLAQTWSEHCKHTIFASPLDDITEGIYRKYIKGATNEVRRKKGERDFCLSVFKDNAGAIAFDDEYAVTHKVETHNTPSLLDPFGGAITGILGVNRDTLGFGLGAKPVLNMYGFCFADPADTTELYRDKAKTQKVLSAKRIMQGVIAGVNSGGNCSGIATPQGFVNFHPRFRGKPLVFVGTVGLIPRKQGGRSLIEKRAKPGDYVVVLGGRVGVDGIHGATFSSVALDSGSPATAVQIGDPITQKKLSDALVKEARDLNLYTSITDNGAGGISCSVAEMAKESNGFEVELTKVPLKYPGLSPWQIWVSESQERMTLAVPPKNWAALQKLMASRGVEATRIGNFTDSGKAVVKNKGKVIMDIDLKFLHDGLPLKYQTSRPPASLPSEALAKDGLNFNEMLLQMLKTPGFTSTAFISRQYDSEVQAVSVTKPLQGKGMVNADATVSRPVLDSLKGVVMSQGLYPEYSELDSYRMAACSIDTAIRNAVAAGADPDHLAILDNFCWSSSNEPERLYQLKEAARGCYDYAVSYGTPFISGKDSMFNDFSGFDKDGQPIKISVPPTLLISSLGVIPDITKALTLDLKNSGDSLYMIGETFTETVPSVNAKRNLKMYRALYQAAQKNLIASAVSVGRGGALIALAKSAIAGGLGVRVELDKISKQELTTETKLLSQTQGRIIVSVAKQRAAEFETIIGGNYLTYLGEVSADEVIRISDGGAEVIATSVADAAKAYHLTFKNY